MLYCKIQNFLLIVLSLGMGLSANADTDGYYHIPKAGLDVSLNHFNAFKTKAAPEWYNTAYYEAHPSSPHTGFYWVYPYAASASDDSHSFGITKEENEYLQDLISIVSANNGKVNVSIQTEGAPDSPLGQLKIYAIDPEVQAKINKLFSYDVRSRTIPNDKIDSVKISYISLRSWHLEDGRPTLSVYALERRIGMEMPFANEADRDHHLQALKEQIANLSTSTSFVSIYPGINGYMWIDEAH